VGPPNVQGPSQRLGILAACSRFAVALTSFFLNLFLTEADCKDRIRPFASLNVFPNDTPNKKGLSLLFQAWAEKRSRFNEARRYQQTTARMVYDATKIRNCSKGEIHDPNNSHTSWPLAVENSHSLIDPLCRSGASQKREQGLTARVSW